MLLKQLLSFHFKKTILFSISTFLLLLTNTADAQWIELGGTNSSSYNNIIQTVVTDAGGNVYAGGRLYDANNYAYVAKWDGTSWSHLGDINSRYFTGSVYSIAVDASGNLYAGGDFSNVTGKYYVAKWDGKVWKELGGENTSTFNNYIYSLTTDASGNLYAAGLFTDATSKRYVAKWDGTSWSELGGTNGSFNNLRGDGYIKSITTDASGSVYAAGGFVDDSDKLYVAKWNGIEWSELGGINGFASNGVVNSIATDANGNVYAAGDLFDANDYGFVKKWNGTAWSKLDSTYFHGITYGLATDASGNLYAGGAYNLIVDGSRHYIARWNGTAWNELDNGFFNDVIFSVTTDPSGSVYTGGRFTNASSKTFVAKYTQALPITLINITATNEKKGVNITWQTGSEINSSYFIVQRSIYGNSFTDIGTVKAIGSGANRYNFMDNDPAAGVNYYRLRIIDKDGSFTYSPIRTVNEKVSFSVSIYPNPVQMSMNLSFKSDQAKAVVAQVVNSEGKVLIRQQIQIIAGTSTQNLNTSSLNRGVYFLKFASIEGETELKFAKE